jgi:hypothetical protein
MGITLHPAVLRGGMATQEVRSRSVKHPKSKIDKAIDDWQEVLYSVLVQYQKEETNETQVQDRNSDGQPSL